MPFGTYLLRLVRRSASSAPARSAPAPPLALALAGAAMDESAADKLRLAAVEGDLYSLAEILSHNDVRPPGRPALLPRDGKRALW